MPVDRLGIVAIGRNEGERLRLCLESVRGIKVPAVYVDSNSTDGSVDLANDLGFAVLELDPAKPCTAARARYEGFRELLSEHQDLDYVFFVDGDCQVEPTWPALAVEFLREHAEVAVVCGRRREQNPSDSVYNRLCDHEWDTPVGEAAAVGGDAVYRVSAYQEAGEFDPTVPAGEEPELCKRIRDRGWKIWRLDAEMTRHDATIKHFKQWWMRQVRTGYAGYDVERRFKIGIFDRIIKSAWIWVIGFPLVTILVSVFLGTLFSPGWAIACLGVAIAVICLQVLRIAWRAKSQCSRWSDRLAIGVFTMAAKVPILVGVLRQIVESIRGQRARIVEYKSADSLPSQS